jgi:hypothetical protein
MIPTHQPGSGRIRKFNFLGFFLAMSRGLKPGLFTVVSAGIEIPFHPLPL